MLEQMIKDTITLRLSKKGLLEVHEIFSDDELLGLSGQDLNITKILGQMASSGDIIQVKLFYHGQQSRVFYMVKVS